MLYMLPKLHKRPFKSRFIANSSLCTTTTTTEFSIPLASCLAAMKSHVVQFCETVYEWNGINLFSSNKILGEILNNQSKCIPASSLPTHDF